MPSTPNIVIAAVAGVAVLGGAAYLERDKLGLSSGIHSVDFRNAPVEVVGTACADPQLTTAGVTKLPLHDGTYQLGQYQFELVGDVRYGDVSGHTGDSNSDKAVFVGSCSSNGKTSQVLFVYGMMDGNPERLASTDLSAANNTLVQSYSVGDGSIQIRANQGMPPALVTLTYALLNGNLVNLNPAAPQSAVQTATEAPEQAAPMAPAAEQTAENANPGAQEDKVDFETFHDQLAPYGQWIQHPTWGTVWHPNQVPADFRPYREGHWEDSDEYGTVWVSNYSWGDIPFHYGRWGYDPNYGWLWQPGYTWSPAWVAWREGAGDIGWFPIPPGYYDGTADFVDDWAGWYGYQALYGAALDAAAFYAMWSFIPADDIYAASIDADIIAPAAYVGFIGKTRGWTRFRVEHGHFVNRAIDRERFHAAFGRQLPASARHDFAMHHAPIVGVARGRAIAARMHVPAAGHTSVGIGVHGSGASAHFGTHTYAHSGFASAHSAGAVGGGAFGAGKRCSRGCTAGAQHSGFGASTHSGFGASASTHSGFGGSGSTHSGFGGSASAHSGFGSTVASHQSGFGASSHSGFGGSSHSGFGGGPSGGFGGGATTQHSGFGGGAYAQHPSSAFGGGSSAQRPSFGGGGIGGMAQRPTVGSSVSRSAPTQVHTSSSSSHHH